MAKVNTGNVQQYKKAIADTVTTNYEDNEAFELSPKSKLIQITSTCLFKEPKFYGNVEDEANAIIDTARKVAQEDPVFLLKLANYLRNEQYLRTISTYLLVYTANQPELKGRNIVHQYAPKIIQRADELKEAMAMQLQCFGKPIPNSLKKGIAESFKNFDEHQVGKYKKQNTKGAVSFKDVIMLTHPKQPSEIIKKILDKKLKTPITWETELSAKGNKKEVWENLLDSNKLPYMASLRNIRNILNANVSERHIDKLCKFIADAEQVKRSKQLPFRFFSAYKEIENESNPSASQFLDALEDAITVSYENIPKIPGTTLIACDTSGSMQVPISKRSSVERYDIGLLLGAMGSKFTDKCILGMFGDTWKVINTTKRSGIIKDTMYMHTRVGEVGYSTNGFLVIRWANEKKIHVDRFMFFSDNQLWDSTQDRNIHLSESSRIGNSFRRDVHTVYKELLDYRKSINPNARMYIFDLAGYGTTSFPEQDNKVIGISGWSDKIFNFIKTVESDPHAQEKYIQEKF